MHVCQSFFLQTLLFTAFVVAVLKILTHALVSTWSLVSSGWEHVERKMHPCSLVTLVAEKRYSFQIIWFDMILNADALAFFSTHFANVQSTVLSFFLCCLHKIFHFFHRSKWHRQSQYCYLDSQKLNFLCLSSCSIALCCYSVS